MKKLPTVSASDTTKNISAKSIFNTIVREDQGAVSFREDNLHEWTSSQLAGYLSEWSCPRTESLREYITAGLLVLDTIAIKVEALQHDLHESCDSNEFTSASISLKKMWLRAFGIACSKVEREDIAILLAEDWLQIRGVD